MRELIVDSFAGGGGASTGIELATGRSVDVAINHNEVAIKMHKTNHPDTKHYIEDIWEVDPLEATQGKPVGLMWASPDCRHFSKAKGGKPVDKNVRGLAWVVVKWAKMVKPRVIMLENVEEFKTWGPLKQDEKGNLYPDPDRKGQTFNLFTKALEKQGYKVEFRELKACDYGAPTTRKRFFMIARCDGKPIVWPEPTHGDPEQIEARMGMLEPWRTAAECIDWSIPCPSIFDRKKPLAENTMKRIARGLKKFVIDNPKPFIVQVNHGGDNFRGQELDKPLTTITSKHGYGLVAPYIARIGQTGFGGDRLQYELDNPLTTIVTKAEHCLITPFLATYYTETSEKEARGQTLDEPIATIPTANRFGLVTAFISKYYGIENSRSVASGVNDPLHTITARQGQALVTAFIAKHYGGNYQGAGSDMEKPLDTITSVDHNALVTAFISRQFKSSVGHKVDEPLATTTVVNKSNLVTAFLLKYYGADVGQKLNEPLHTITSKDRFGLVTIKGQDYQIVDIGMRMLQPHELFKAQGFPEDYIIDIDYTGKIYPKTAQVASVGNSVPPQFAEALVRSNLPELCQIDKKEVV